MLIFLYIRRTRAARQRRESKCQFESVLCRAAQSAGWWSLDGSGTRRFEQFPTQREAIKFRDATGVAVRAGVHVADAASTTVKEAGELWLEKCRLDGLETGTVRNYKEHLNLHILPLIGDTKLTRLTRPVVESFRDKLLETRSQTTARKVVGSLKSLVSEAQRRGLVAQNVAMGTKVKTASRHEKKVTIPTKDEIRNFAQLH